MDSLPNKPKNWVCVIFSLVFWKAGCNAVGNNTNYLSELVARTVAAITITALLKSPLK